MRVLFVEDYEPLRKSVAKGLREAGLAVDIAADGEEGLWLATSNTHDVVILDLMLPGLDGLSILRKLREAGRETHVLILTAKGEVGDRVEGLDAGADDYLCKPFAFEELLARVHALVRRGYGRPDPVIRVSDLRINTAAQRVWRGEDEIHLTAREYALIEYLAMRAGEVVSRTDIWEEGDVARVEISNTGCPLTGAQVAQVFERFWRGDAARCDAGVHCGLGLALVQRIVTSLGGRAEARVDGDGVFTVRLALRRNPVTS